MIPFVQRLERRWLRGEPASLPDAALANDIIPVVLITGATRGIGRALAFEFARHGHHLLLAARSHEGLQHTATAINAEYPGIKVFQAAGDLTAQNPLPPVEEALLSNRLMVDYLINNAGMGLSGPFKDTRPEDLDSLIGLNIRSLTLFMRHFLPGMVQRGRGGVLNVASLGGLLPGPYQAAYYASKAYVVSLTEAVAHENFRKGVRIAALAPGPVETAFHGNMQAESALYRRMPVSLSPERVAETSYKNFMAWQRVIVPGIGPTFAAAIVRCMPSYLTIPVTALILKPR